VELGRGVFVRAAVALGIGIATSYIVIDLFGAAFLSLSSRAARIAGAAVAFLVTFWTLRLWVPRKGSDRTDRGHLK
jgi:putative flippase GtrA